MPLRRIELHLTVVLHGGLPELLDILARPDSPWFIDPRPAVLLWRPDTGGWYVFSRDHFQRACVEFLQTWNNTFPNTPLASHPVAAGPLVQHIFNIHETTQTQPVQTGETPTHQTVELFGNQPAAVWIDPSGLPEFQTRESSAPPPRSPPPSSPPPLPFSPDPDPERDSFSHSHTSTSKPPPLPRSSPPPATAPPPSTRPRPQQQQQQQQQPPPSSTPPPTPRPQQQQHQQQQQQPPEDFGTREEVLRRFPHLDISAPAPGHPWTVDSLHHVEVYLDPEPARTNEVSDPTIISAPATQQTFDLSVWLTASEHFQLAGPEVQPLTLIRTQPRSTSARFALLCKRPPSEADPAALTASLSYNGRPCGRVLRTIGLPTPPPATLTLEISTTAVPADLIVEVVRPTDGSSAFEVQITTRLLPSPSNSVRGRWPLQNAEEWVAKTFENLTQDAQSARDVYERLRGVGKQLFLGAPDAFKQIFWKIACQPSLRSQLKTLLIMSDDPCVPWELMIPAGGPAGAPKMGALGQEFLIGRWVRGDGRPPTQNIRIHHSLVLAPQYQGQAKLKLSHADPEVALVQATVPGMPLRPVSRERLRSELPKADSDLVHVICHGEASQGAQQLTFDDGPFDTQQLQGMEAAEDFFDAHKPFVFLNACEVGRPHPTLTGTGADGFAPVFLQLGASAVIAPLWAIKDSIAHNVALEFYKTLGQNRSCQPAQLLRTLRARAYSGPTLGEDTYAAYCFYGDPLATIQL